MLPGGPSQPPSSRAWDWGRIRAALAELEGQPARDYEARVAERAAKEPATGKGLRGPKPLKEPGLSRFLCKRHRLGVRGGG